MEGPLSKWTNVMNGWQYRWFVLDDGSGLLSYYTSKEKMMRGSRRGCVRLKGAVIGIDDEDESTFTITCDQKTFHFQARDLEERQKWINALEDTIRHTQTLSVFTNGIGGTAYDPGSNFIPSIDDFDKRLAEADVYLQMLIDQSNALDAKMVAQSELNEESGLDEEDVEKYRSIKITTTSMIESIKHTIVLLQIAKSYNLDTLFKNQDPISFPLPTRNDTMMPKPTPSHGMHPIRETAPLAGAHDLVETGREVIEDGAASLPSLPISEESAEESPHFHMVYAGVTPIVNSPRLKQTPPPTSYSSSEDEEEWEDAVEGGDEAVVRRERKESAQSHLSSYSQQLDNSSQSNYSAVNELTTPAVTPGAHGPSPFGGEGGGIAEWNNSMWDKLYGGEEDDDVGDMSQQSSMIGHLLSQLRIGMDLTKITLPTYILERRSLLEQYADFFAHPDLFVKIATCTTPYERMVQCMRWYLSAFSAGRASDVAKKPYNPIIGETLQCWWDPTIGTNSDPPPPQTSDSAFRTDGSPCPWTKETDVAFIAEQVSHHPPISAFYAECPSHQISANGYIWTKSKFLGLAIGVEMVGQGVVTLIEHEEDYVITFPKAYGRSILTVPWVELGGTCEIKCMKTGYSGKIDFLTKPFYGGDKNRIRAEVYSPIDKKPMLVIEGHWNGVMNATDGKTKITSEFVNTKTMPVVPKQVKSIAEQDEFESRRLWKEVTYCLKNRLVEKATGFKARLEQRQRDEAKERAEKGERWETKFFHENGEHWVYDQPLIKRTL